MKKILLILFAFQSTNLNACVDLLFKNNFEAAQMSENEAARFLTQATFGPQLSEIKHLQYLGIEDWLDKQMCEPETTMTETLLANGPDGTNYYPESLRVSWNTYLNANDQLRQKMVFALNQIMVVSNRGIVCPTCPVGIARYNDVLVNNAFGNFRDLLEDVTLNPMMGFYLSMLGNEKANELTNSRADENYAREIMQLFSIGLTLLNNDGTEQLDMMGAAIPSYNINHVKELAKVMTGWTWANTTSWQFPVADASLPMEPFVVDGTAVFHDYSSKDILGHGGSSTSTHIEANLSPEEDLDRALDVIFNHPNVGPFISKQLIQKFITSNPSPAYVSRVADVFNDNGMQVRGDLGAVIKAILLDEEARNINNSNATDFGKLREPMLRVLHLWRSFLAEINYQGEISELIFFGQQLGQSPYDAPSVFNYFRPDFKSSFVDAPLLTPEFQLNSESNLILYQNLLKELTLTGFSGVDNPTFYHVVMNGEPLREWLLDSQLTFINNLNLILMNGEMPIEMINTLNDLLTQYQIELGAPNTLNENDLTTRAAVIVYLIMSSPHYLIQR